MRRYDCPQCGAEYAVIEIAVRVGPSPMLRCLHCGRPLPDDEGPSLVQYTLLRRPNQDALDDLDDPGPLSRPADSG
jgi:transposase-like protein